MRSPFRRQGQGSRPGCCRSFHTYTCKTLFPTIRPTLLGSDFHVRNNMFFMYTMIELVPMLFVVIKLFSYKSDFTVPFEVVPGADSRPPTPYSYATAPNSLTSHLILEL
ncbi:hypothetical protein AVEN_47874-1 [Araneus ventricosus]|uniref:Uncharacterized protein n=1 Tax=Araneus ventricosus TaxID=182803 RepID=A0A4Y2X7E2_ARAVE|nr:hypothetical protein AVEN_47874-1 [Araneus ventricosus]